MYFTDEVKIKIDNDDKFVNEFMILNNIGKGAFSKVKKVVRQNKNSEDEVTAFAMKMMHKPALEKQRAVTYSD